MEIGNMMMMMAVNSVRWGGDTEDDEDIIIINE